MKGEVHLIEIVQFRRQKIFVCNDSSNEMRTISFIGDDYSAFTCEMSEKTVSKIML